jgi:hypothetical protein
MAPFLEARELFFQVLHPFARPPHPRFKFLPVNQSLGITVDQAGNPSTQLAHLGFQSFILFGLLRVQALPIFLLQPLGLFKQPTGFLPDRCICLVQARSAPKIWPKRAGI